MKHYKDNENKVYAYESDGSQDEFISEDLIAITDEEAFTIANPPLTAEQLQEQTNAEARAYLASTDWYIIRFTETGAPIPLDISEARQQARQVII